MIYELVQASGLLLNRDLRIVFLLHDSEVGMVDSRQADACDFITLPFPPSFRSRWKLPFYRTTLLDMLITLALIPSFCLLFPAAVKALSHTPIDKAFTILTLMASMTILVLIVDGWIGVAQMIRSRDINPSPLIRLSIGVVLAAALSFAIRSSLLVTSTHTRQNVSFLILAFFIFVLFARVIVFMDRRLKSSSSWFLSLDEARAITASEESSIIKPFICKPSSPEKAHRSRL